jgi:assimilatory nitrate reductase catalytic subunit
MKSSAKLTRGEIKGLLSICFNPLVSLPDNNFVRAQLEKLEFYVAIDFFLNETARYADIVLPGSLHEEDEGTVTTAEGRVIKINKAVDCPGEAREDWRHHPGHRQSLRQGKRIDIWQPGRDVCRIRTGIERRYC